MPLVPRHLNPKRLTGMALLCPATVKKSTQPSSFIRGGTTLSTKPDINPCDVGLRSLNVGCFKIVWLAVLLVVGLNVSAGGVRLRDIVMISGARDNQLVGYGLVAGLAGDGDKDQTYDKQTVANMLMRYGVNIPAATLSEKNIAVVMVTADIPPFLKNGARIDVTVASMGDAKSLTGGVLLQTPLLGADGKVYAVAQGPLVLGGFSAGEGGAGGATVTKNHPTTAQIINGALVEREIPTQFVHDHAVELLLRDPSFNSAATMAAAINDVFTNSAHALDSTTVHVQIPAEAEASPVEFIARLNMIEITPDTPARIIINERTGTIVATAAIHISSCAVASGNITINVEQSLDVSQPSPFSNTGSTTVTPRTSTSNVTQSLDVSQPGAFGGGSTAVTPRTDTSVTESKSSMVALQELPTVEKVAAALNALGATPRDMMSIFQAMKQAGALQAELITR